MKELGDEQTGGTLDFWTSAFETRTGALACESNAKSLEGGGGEAVTSDIISTLVSEGFLVGV